MRTLIRICILAMVVVIAQLEIAGLAALARDAALGRGPLEKGLAALSFAPRPARRASAREIPSEFFSRAPASAREPGDTPYCEALQLRIVTEDPLPELSLATLSDASGHHDLVRVGDRALGHEVVFIGAERQEPTVWLRRQGSICRAVFGELASPSLPGAETTAPPASRPVADLLGPIRVFRPRNGAPGVELRGIRPGTLLSALDLRDGDVLQRVNGFDVSSPSAAIRAYMQLKTSHELHVELSRHGLPLVRELHLR